MPDRKYGLVNGLVDLLKGRAPLPPRPRPPGLPKPPAAETPGTPQYELSRVQDDARSNPAFQPKRDGTTFCNRAVCETVKRMKGPMGALTYPSGEYAVANDAARYLAEDSMLPSGSWRAVDTPTEAQQLANQGIVVVGVQANRGRDERGRQRHGRMVTVRPEAIPGLAADYERKQAASGVPKAILPIVNNIGVAVGVESAETAFPSKDRPVHYYTPR
jgi:hypothetical protein